MVVHRRRRVPVLVVAVGLALTACSSGNDTAARTTPPTTESTTTPPSSTAAATGPVGWVDGFCGAVNGFITDQNNLPVPPDDGTIAEIQRGTSTYLGDYVEVLDKALAALSALPPATDPVAEAAASTATENYTAARDAAATAKTELDAADPDDVEAQNSAVDGLVVAQEHAHKSLDPITPLAGSPELTEAAATAPNCT